MVDFVAWGNTVLTNYGLLGLFIISLVTSASMLLFTPGALFVVIAGKMYNPLIVALVAALGSTIGEYTSYFLGLGGNYILEKKHVSIYERIKEWFKKHGFILFPIFAAGPLPMDLLSIVAGTLKYDVKLFFLGVFIGKFIRCLALAYLGYYVLDLFPF
jgi:membrane protein YqaA with SNARE-associated domain